MSWSWRIGRIAGIDVFIHFTFFLLLAWIGYSYYALRGSMADALGGIVFILALFGVVVLHELGHALAARRYGIATRDITLLPIGGLARLDQIDDAAANATTRSAEGRIEPEGAPWIGAQMAAAAADGRTLRRLRGADLTQSVLFSMAVLYSKRLAHVR